jgi:hypothetical protein
VRLLELAGVSVEQTVLEAAGLQLAELADADSAMAAAAMRPAMTFSGHARARRGRLIHALHPFAAVSSLRA